MVIHFCCYLCVCYQWTKLDVPVFTWVLDNQKKTSTTPHKNMSEIIVGIFVCTSMCQTNIPHLFSLSQHNSNYQAPATPQMIPDGGPGSTSCPSEENQNQQPSQTPNQLQPQGGTQEPGSYMLTPNAPVLFGSSYSPFEKPPPYACWALSQTYGACWRITPWPSQAESSTRHLVDNLAGRKHSASFRTTL